jgi:hypothetical protein
MSIRIVRLLIAVAMALPVAVSAEGPSAQAGRMGQQGTKRDSERMQKSLTAMLVRAGTPPAKGKPAPPLRTTFTDRELNAWLADDGKVNVPEGLVSPSITFTGPGTLTIQALVDLDAVRKSRERGWLDPFAYLQGVLAISMKGSLTGRGGQGTFDVESAVLGNVPVPRVLLQELITYYSKSPDFPDGITLAKPFPLPAGVRDLAIQRGSAAVVQ